MADREISKIIQKAKKDKEILAVALFGSQVKGNGRDIDICLILDRKHQNIEMSRKKLDFLAESENRTDIQIFQQLPIYIRIRVIKDGKILFCRNLDKLYELAFETIKEFDLFKRSYETYLNVIENG